MKLRLGAPTALLLVAIGSAYACSGPAEPDLEGDTGTSWVVERDPELGTASFVQPKSPPPPSLAPGGDAERAARAFLERYRAVFGMRDPASELVLEEAPTPNALGMVSVAFGQHERGVHVLDARMSAHFDAEGRVAFLSGRYRAGLDGVDVTPALAPDAARGRALAATSAPAGVTLTAEVLELAITLAGPPRLVHVVSVHGRADEAPFERRVLVDAHTGAIVADASVVAHAREATGRGSVGGVRRFEVEEAPGGSYRMRRPASGGASAVRALVYRAPRGTAESTSTNLDAGWSPVAVDVYTNLAYADRYFRARHARSLRGRTVGEVVAGNAAASERDTLVAVVDVPSSADLGTNAWFLPQYRSFGFSRVRAEDAAKLKPLTSFDVVAHEVTHGLIASTLRLSGTPTAAALNESLADTFASLAEQHFLSEGGPAAELEAEGIDPDLKGNAVVLASPRYFGRLSDPLDGYVPAFGEMVVFQPGADPHVNAGIPTRAFWLSVSGLRGGEAPGFVATPGVGWAAAHELYGALVFGRAVAPSASFADAARALVALARKLPKVEGRGDAAKSVACAWAGVGVLGPEEVSRNWGIDCARASSADAGADASPAPTSDCFVDPAKACAAGNVCSWTGGGYCCKKPFASKKVCFSDTDCGKGEVCGRRTTDTKSTDPFTCTPSGVDACVDEASRPATATWKVRALVFPEATHAGKTSTMTEAERGLARSSLTRFASEIRKLSAGTLAVDLDVVEMTKPLTGFTPYEDAVWVSEQTRGAYSQGLGRFDGWIVSWKHGASIPYSWGGLTLGASRGHGGHSDVPIDIMLEEADRPYEALVHEFGHQVEGFYGCGNLLDACEDLGQTRCAGDSEYPDGSWLCCYRNIFRGNVRGQCLSPKNVAAKGKPFSR